MESPHFFPVFFVEFFLSNFTVAFPFFFFFSFFLLLLPVVFICCDAKIGQVTHDIRDNQCFFSNTLIPTFVVTTILLAPTFTPALRLSPPLHRSSTAAPSCSVLVPSLRMPIPSFPTIAMLARSLHLVSFITKHRLNECNSNINGTYVSRVPFVAQV